MAFGNVLRGFGQRAMDIGRSTMGRARDVGRSTMDRAMDSRIGQSIIDSPLGRAAGNLGSAAGNYSQIMISRLASRLGISEEATKKLLIGGSGVGAASYMMGDDSNLAEFINSQNISFNDMTEDEYVKLLQENNIYTYPEPHLLHQLHKSTMSGERDRFGFGIDARRLTDE